MEIINEKLMIDQDADLDKIKQETVELKSAFNKYYSDYVKQMAFDDSGITPIAKRSQSTFDEYDNFINKNGGEDGDLKIRELAKEHIKDKGLKLTWSAGEQWLFESGLTNYLLKIKNKFLENLSILHENDYKAMLYDKFGASPQLKNKLNISQHLIANWLLEFFKLSVIWREANFAFEETQQRSKNIKNVDNLISMLIKAGGAFGELLKSSYVPYFSGNNTHDNNLVLALTKFKNFEHDRGSTVVTALDMDDRKVEFDKMFNKISNVDKTKLHREAMEDIQDYTERTYEV